MDQVKRKKRKKPMIVNNITTYHCTKCNLFKDISHFEKRSDTSSLRSHCKECRHIESAHYHRTVRHRMSPEKVKLEIEQILKWKTDPLTSIKKYILRLSKNHARVKQIEHLITIDDIHIPNKCPILNIPFDTSSNKYGYSIDRIDNSKGYLPNNIAIISNLANTMKNQASFKELLTFSKNIKSYIKR